MKRIKEMKKNQKGFTLVELIVVLVILAILAAMLVPALLGYIDRARQGKYTEEVHSIYTALQVINDERYAAGGDHLGTLTSTPKDEVKEVNDMISPASITADNVAVTYKDGATDKTKHDYWSITGLSKCNFTASDGATVEANMTNGVVNVTKVTPPATTP